MLRAAESVLGGGAFEVRREPSSLVLTSSTVDSLLKVHDQLRDRRVRDAARRLLVRNRQGDRTTTLMLNRQAAFAGVIVLCASPVESPLGPITLELESDDLDAVIRWLTAYGPESVDLGGTSTTSPS